MKKPILLILIFLLLNCNKKMGNTQDFVFEIENTEINSEDILSIKIWNKTNKNYFIVLDTTRLFDYLTLNYKINNSILLKPKLFSNQDSIKLNVEFNMNKLLDKEKSNFDCIQKERQHTLKIINDLKKLKGIIIIEKNSAFKFNIPFRSNFYNCSRKYFYSFKKGEKYYLQLEYKMDENLIHELAEISQLKKLNRKGINPYFKKIVSNKVPLETN